MLPLLIFLELFHKPMEDKKLETLSLTYGEKFVIDTQLFL